MSYWEIFNEMGIGTTPKSVATPGSRNYSYNDFRLDSLYLESVVFNNINKNANTMNESCLQSLTESVDITTVLTEAESDMDNTEKNAIASLLQKFGVAVDNMFNSIYKTVTSNKMWIKINKKKILKTTIAAEKTKNLVDKDDCVVGTVIINSRFKFLPSKLLDGDIGQVITPKDDDTKTSILQKYEKAILGNSESTDLTSFNGKQNKLMQIIEDISTQIVKDRTQIKRLGSDKKYSKSEMPGDEFKEFKKSTNRMILSYKCKIKTLNKYMDEIMSVLRIFAHENKLKIK